MKIIFAALHSSTTGQWTNQKRTCWLLRCDIINSQKSWQLVFRLFLETFCLYFCFLITFCNFFETLKKEQKHTYHCSMFGLTTKCNNGKWICHHERSPHGALVARSVSISVDICPVTPSSPSKARTQYLFWRLKVQYHANVKIVRGQSDSEVFPVSKFTEYNDIST